MIVKAKTGKTVRQNPSDPDATYDGYQGPGYQVQLTETCHPDNGVQLITCALPQTAAVPDEEAMAPVLADLQASGLLPKELLGDTHYPSEENVQRAQSYGVELLGSVPRAAPAEGPEDLTIDDFVIDEKTEQVVCCPDGQTPVTSVHDSAQGKTRTTMPAAACGRCAFRNHCPVQAGPDGYHLEHTAKQRRVAGRRRVFQAIYLKIAGWNILRASVCAKMREWVHTRAQRAVLRVCAALCVTSRCARHAAVGLKIAFSVFYHRSSIVRAFPHAA